MFVCAAACCGDAMTGAPTHTDCKKRVASHNFDVFMRLVISQQVGERNTRVSVQQRGLSLGAVDKFGGYRLV